MRQVVEADYRVVGGSVSGFFHLQILSMAGRGEISDAAYRLGAGEYYMQTFQGLILGPDGLPIGGTFNYVTTFTLVGPETLVIHQNVKFVISAGGDLVTFQHDNLMIECH